PVRLRIVAHMKNVLAHPPKVPLSIKGLRTRIVLPNPQKHDLKTRQARSFETFPHQCRANTRAEDSTIDIQPHQFDGAALGKTVWHIATAQQLCITDAVAGTIRYQERAARILQFFSNL